MELSLLGRHAPSTTLMRNGSVFGSGTASRSLPDSATPSSCGGLCSPARVNRAINTLSTLPRGDATALPPVKAATLCFRL
ncbi:hypothetical protein FCM35_KLT05192 [Carex littledalei]|uniref:Uncharacterized protein n=1 Tax=Carex littledalei TaxID=544730 RepID=A0A833V9J8_9POAL|nr:hypothetical protein FCM35_KLT05192 [Carex littledalei]